MTSTLAGESPLGAILRVGTLSSPILSSECSSGLDWLFYSFSSPSSFNKYDAVKLGFFDCVGGRSKVGELSGNVLFVQTEYKRHIN